jgi:hypothetical protein
LTRNHREPVDEEVARFGERRVGGRVSERDQGLLRRA